MRQVRCALVGHGMIGREHAKILAANPIADLAVVCDTDPQAASGVPAGTRFTVDLDDALDTEGLDALWVCTPQQVHLPVVEAGMVRGLHVFCEKPFASSLGDADRMMELDASTAGSLVIGHTLRFDPNYVAVHQAAAEGRLGEIVHVSARWNAPDYEGRIISGRTTVPQEMAIHDLDVMRWLVGDIERGICGGPLSTRLWGPGRTRRWPPCGLRQARSGLSTTTGSCPSLPDSAATTAWLSSARGGVLTWRAVTHRRWCSVSTASNTSTPATTPTRTMCRTGRYRPRTPSSLGRVRDGRAWPLALADARAALVAALAMDRSIEEGRPVDIAEFDG